ncbi:MAG: hypothetical protein ACRDHZ_00500 [Ktedonobacteraceae bacterium]
MDWAAWGPTIVAVITAIFIAGQISGRIKDQEVTIKDHHDRLDGHDDKLETHAIQLTRIEAWKDGYNAGSRKSAASQ